MAVATFVCLALGIVSVLLWHGGQELRWERMASVASGLNQPMGLALDERGNLYAAESGSGRILLLDSSGSHVEMARVGAPTGLALGPGGEMYVASRREQGVVRVDGQGRAQVVVRGVADPMGVFATQDKLWVADRSTDRVLVLDTDTEDLRATEAPDSPMGVIFDGHCLAVGCSKGVWLCQGPQAGRFIAMEQARPGLGMAVDRDGTLLILSIPDGRLYLAKPDGRVLKTKVAIPGARDMVRDRDGNIFVSTQYGRVLRIPVWMTRDGVV